MSGSRKKLIFWWTWAVNKFVSIKNKGYLRVFKPLQYINNKFPRPEKFNLEILSKPIANIGPYGPYMEHYKNVKYKDLKKMEQ